MENEKNKKADTKNEILEWIVPIAVAIILAMIIKTFIFYPIEIPSESMDPTIKIGDRIIVTRVYDRSKLKEGDIVVFYSEELKERLIKRLIGLPGDEVEVKDGGQVYVNGKKINEPYVVYKDDLSKKFKVPADHYLFFGDNRPRSLDSRRWSNPYIAGKDIKGKAQFIMYPFKRFGKFVIGKAAVNH